mgnify:FL=1
MARPLPSTAFIQRGFSLVEIMVGMLVGLVVAIIIYQVVSTNEALKRSTTAGADVQQNGMFSLSTIERDVRAAGWGMPTADVMPCARYFTYSDDGTASGAVPDFSGAPVRIVDGGAGPGASDRIVVLWGNSVRANVRNPLLQNVTAVPNGEAAKLYPVSAVGQSSTGGFAWLTDDKNDCALVRITASVPNAASPDTVILSHDPAAGTASQPSYNPPDGAMGGLAWPTLFDTNPRIFDVGALTQRSYSVANASLMAKDYFSNGALVQVASHVVGLKARYGISDVGSQVVTQWVSATLGPAGNWALPSPADAKRIKAIRLAVVVRSPLRERPDPATGSCNITSTPPATWPDGPAIDLSNDPDWRCYRYRSFETVVPLRNVLWANLS